MKANWYNIGNIDEIDSPSLVIFPQRVKENIRLIKNIIPDTKRIRPHVKTHKSINITKLFLDEGITKFKCATISEAEMLGMAGAPDVLLAYQPVGPKVERLADLTYEYPATAYSCLVDNLDAAKNISKVFSKLKLLIPVYIDINVGMNRTGIDAEHAEELWVAASKLPGMKVAGLHAYDGHLRDSDIKTRTTRCNDAFAPVEKLFNNLQKKGFNDITIIAGGSPTFSIHAKRDHVECSPGTFVYWDAGYKAALPELEFQYGAIIISRIISIPTEDTICIDLGHKSIASENAIDKRIQFFNAPDLEPIGHSEEHMILKHAKDKKYKIGDVLYGVPYHICPTCALYDAMMVVEKGHGQDRWAITARGRRISI